MADFSTCYNFMMDNEDAPRACAVIHDPTTAYPAAQAISGINSAFYPMQFTTIAALPQSQRAAAVESFYQKEFWNKWFDALASTDVAARVFDTAVNMGPDTAVKFLQQAVNSFHADDPLGVDGCWGPITVNAANAVNPQTLLAAYHNIRCGHYRAIGGPNLAGWLARAAK
jgi:lysozyme family protein